MDSLRASFIISVVICCAKIFEGLAKMATPRQDAVNTSAKSAAVLPGDSEHFRV